MASSNKFRYRLTYWIFTVVMLGTMLGGCSTSKVEQENSLPGIFYKRFEGTIGDTSAVLQLQRQGHSIKGQYHKGNESLLLQSFRDSSTNDDSLRVEVYHAAGRKRRPQDTLFFTYRNGKLTGKFSRQEKEEAQKVSLSEAYPAGTYHFKTAYYSDSLRVYPDSAKSPSAHISQGVVYLGDSGDVAQWLNGEIKSMLGIGRDSSFAGGLKAHRRHFFSKYKKTVDEFGQLKYQPTLNYESMNNLWVEYNTHNLIVLKHEVYQYTGGAHGMFGTHSYCFDLQQKKQLALGDIITADSLTLQHKLEKHFRRQYNITPDKSLTSILFKDELTPNDNFYISYDGIGFRYNQYEVAPHAAGVIDVLIPYSDLKAYLRPAFKKRMDL